MVTSPHPKFGFDTEFFEVVGGIRVNAPSGATTSAAGLPLPRGPEAQRQQAYTEGHTAGLAEGQAQAQADLARMQQHLQNTLLAMQQALDDRETQVLRHMLGLTQRTLQHLIGHAAQHYPAEVLEHHLRQILPLARTDEALTLRIAPQARGYHEKLGLSQATILGLPLRVVPDATLGPVDAVVEWQHGGVEARLADHDAALSELLNAAGATALPPTTLNLNPLPAAATSPTATERSAIAIPAAPIETSEPTFTQTLNTAVDAAATARATRAAALLGDDELVDALK